MKWWYISIILCIYGFCKEFRPSEPFITPYLITFKNFTVKQVNEEIYPVGTYCYLSLLVLIFLLTDFLRYKPVLLAGSLSGVVTWSFLIWGTTISEMQVVEFFYGLFLASEVSYYTYIYAKVEKKHFQKVTSHTRAAILLGKATAGLSSQLLVFLSFNYLQLNYFSVFGVGTTVLLVFLLPSVSRSFYFHRKAESSSTECGTVESFKGESFPLEAPRSRATKCNTAFSLLFHDFRAAFKNVYVLKWSAWWALATCGYLQAISYCQLLWQDMIQGKDAALYHGYVESAFAVSGAAVALGVGYLKVQWKIWGELFLGVLTLGQGGLLYYSASINNLYMAYIVFILYRDFYEAAITIATYEVAKFINPDSYALVFGINTFAALVVQTILTAVVLGTLGIGIRLQFQIYGSYHFAVGLAFLAGGILKLILLRKNFIQNS